jgi:hypothetical protein
MPGNAYNLVYRSYLWLLWLKLPDSKDCTRNLTVPRHAELVLATWDYLNDKPGAFTIFIRGEKDDSVDPREAIAQLFDPEPANPVFLMGLRLPLLAKSLVQSKRSREILRT